MDGSESCLRRISFLSAYGGKSLESSGYPVQFGQCIESHPVAGELATGPAIGVKTGPLGQCLVMMTLQMRRQQVRLFLSP